VSTFETINNSSGSATQQAASTTAADRQQRRPASTYHPGRAFRLANGLMTKLLRAGLPAGSNYLLTVPGRKSGQPRTNAVTVIEYEGERWLTSPFGQVDWVRNLRAAGQATLRRGRRVEIFSAEEVSPAEAAPLLKWLLTETKVPSAVRSQYKVDPGAPLASYEQEALYHPVFRVSAVPVA
jgi:deazaflavin-dependent oxidoreductase (nitroreductase family)